MALDTFLKGATQSKTANTAKEELLISFGENSKKAGLNLPTTKTPTIYFMSLTAFVLLSVQRFFLQLTNFNKFI